MILSPRGLRDATSNIRRLALSGRIADLRPMPAETVDDAPGRSVCRYRPPEGVVPAGPPVLFVPPPDAPARCYDLRRGCSLAEHVVRAGRRSYLLDHGTARYDDADLGVQRWVGDVLPGAIRAVSRDAGGQPVQLVGWCRATRSRRYGPSSRWSASSAGRRRCGSRSRRAATSAC